MTLPELKEYRQQLKSEGKTASTSKEYGKVEDLIKTLQPEKYDEETVSSAYSKLSSGVIEYGGWTEMNIENIKEHTGEYPLLASQPRPGSGGGDLPSYLNSFQETAYQAAGSPELRESIIQQIEPEGMERPEPLDRVETFEEMREEYGVAEMETTLTDLKAQREELYATARQRRQAAEGEPVALGVIGGRVSEIERQTNERVDAINREINTVTDQLQMSYGVIETYMNFMGQDYQDAVAAYNEEFNRNLQIYKLVDEEMDEQQASARSNLQLYANAIVEGNIDYGSLSSSQKAFLNKMEVQSGLPMGFIGSLKATDADGKIISTSTRDSGGMKYADIIMRMPDGSLKTVTQTLGASGSGGGGTSSSAFRSALQRGRDDLERGYSWGSVWDRIRDQFPEVSNEKIDTGLGTDWREGGAYERWSGKGSVDTSQDLKDAASAINSGADPLEVRRRFIENHPDEADAYDDYIAGGT